MDLINPNRLNTFYLSIYFLVLQKIDWYFGSEIENRIYMPL